VTLFNYAATQIAKHQIQAARFKLYDYTVRTILTFAIWAQ